MNRGRVLALATFAALAAGCVANEPAVGGGGDDGASSETDTGSGGTGSGDGTSTGSGGGTSTGSEGCTPGATQPCTCPGGSTGSQTCNDSGTWDACEGCPPECPPGASHPWVEQVQLLAPGGSAEDQFGAAVAIDGDMAVVGAPYDDVPCYDGDAVDQGSAHVFTRSGGVWELAVTPEYDPDHCDDSDRYGATVAVSGGWVVVGAPFDSVSYGIQSGGADSGSAYLQYRVGADWTPPQELNHVDGTGDFNAHFGSSVAIDGEVLVVGQPEADVYQAEEGGQVVSYIPGEVVDGRPLWEEEPGFIEYPVLGVGDNFGASVAMSGDTMVVGAPFSDGTEVDCGAAYVSMRYWDPVYEHEFWEQPVRLEVGDAAASDSIGASVATDGDTIVVGAPDDDEAGVADVGAIHVFARSGYLWGQPVTLHASDAAAGDRFGAAVAIDGDIIVVGSPNHDGGNGAAQGSVYVFSRTNGAWTEQGQLVPADSGAGDNVGVSVAISNDTIVVGAPLDDVGGNTDQGSAFVYRACAE